MVNLLIYIIVLVVVIWVLDGLNLNNLFKQNRVLEARVFYIMLAFSLTYLTSSFIISFLNSLK